MGTLIAPARAIAKQLWTHSTELGSRIATVFPGPTPRSRRWPARWPVAASRSRHVIVVRASQWAVCAARASASRCRSSGTDAIRWVLIISHRPSHVRSGGACVAESDHAESATDADHLPGDPAAAIRCEEHDA